MKVLLVDDDDELAAVVTAFLRHRGHHPDRVSSGADAVWRCGESDYDVVVLDVGLPDRDGMEVCRQLRQGGTSVPVLLLTGRRAVPDRVAGLDAGADDYLTKPFALDELEARLRAKARRGGRAVSASVQHGPVVVDPEGQQVLRDGRPVPLVGRELQLVLELVRAAGRVVSRDRLVDRLWSSDHDVRDNTLDALVSAVRAKLDRPFDAPLLVTVRGSGYRLLPTPGAQGADGPPPTQAG